jgi:hypothetical protein
MTLESVNGWIEIGCHSDKGHPIPRLPIRQLFRYFMIALN